MSIRRFALPLVAVLLGAAFGLHRLVDPDLPQQIAVGRAILSGETPIGVSGFVHPFPAYPYVEDKWLASVGVALIDRWAGVHGLMAYQIALCALVAASWFLLLRGVGARSGAALAGAALLLAANAYRLEPRPDTWSHAGLALALWALAAGVPWRVFRWTVPLGIAVWAHLHGYFVNGLLALAAGTLASALGDRRPSLGGARGRTAWLRGGLVLAASAAACLSHPQGWRALVWPVRQLQALREEPALRSALTEFVPTTDLLAGAGAPAWIVLAGGPALGLLLALRRGGSPAWWRGGLGLALASAWCAAPPEAAQAWPYRLALGFWIAASVEAPSAWREGRRLEGVAFAGFTALALPMVRNLSLVPPVAAMLAVPAAQALWERATAAWSPRAVRLVGAAAVGAACLVTGWARLADRMPPGTYRAPGWTGWGWDVQRFPAGAAAFIRDEALPAELLNNFDTSGWLLRAMHPGRRVFIADNTSMYPGSFLLEYRERVMAGRVDPEELHARYGVRTAVLDHAAMETPGLVARLSASPAWVLVHLDRAAAVWVRAGEAARDPGARERVDLDLALPTLAETVPSPRGPMPGAARRLFPELNLGIFLRAAGRPDLALREADRMWDVGADPAIATFAAASAEEAGDLGSQVGRLEQAHRGFPDAAAVRRWLARARFARGVARADRHDLDGAREDLRRSLELAPGERGTAFALARVEAASGNPSAALDHLARAVDGAGGEPLRELAERDPQLGPLLRRLPAR